MAATIKMVFPSGYQDNASKLQLEALCEFGAHIIYAYLNKDVTLHKVLDKEESQKIDEQMEKSFEKGELNRELIFKKREELAVKNINSIIEKEGINEIVLIYGLAHDFEKYWNENSKINFEEYEFDYDKTKFQKGGSLTTSLHNFDIQKSETENSKKVIEMLKNNEKVPAWLYQHLDTKLQIKVLPSLERLKDFNDKGKFTYMNELEHYNYLIKYAKSDEVKKEIKRLY